MYRAIPSGSAHSGRAKPMEGYASHLVKHNQVFLENGLQLIIAEAHTSPVVSAWIWYRVGSRNEHRVPTGLSHWVEHMLFKGTERYPKGAIMRMVSQRGGYVNAMTGQDFTAYYATIASEHLDLVLDYEADRMTGAAFDPGEVESERSVILSEREGGENEPGLVLSEEVAATAFHRHPYRNQPIGWRDDLLRISREDLYAYYRSFYRPSNAVLVIVGDVDTDVTTARVRELFGPLPDARAAAPAVPEEPQQAGERRLRLRLPGAASLLEVGYHAPEAAHPDFVPLTVAAALLTGGRAVYSFSSGQSRSARLYQALVEGELASSADCMYHPTLDPYLFSLGATVRQDVRPEKVEEALLREIERLQTTPAPQDELAAAIRQTQARLAYSCESVTSQALTLGFAEMVDRVARVETIMDQVSRVTPEEVMRVSRAYLSEDRRTVGWFIPEENGCAQSGSAPAQHRSRRRVWAFTGEPSEPLPAGVIRAELDNGITVLMRPRHTSPAFALAGRVPFGAYLDTDDTAGLTSLTSSSLRRGTRAHTFQELNRTLDSVGASLTFSTGHDELSVGGRCLSDDLDLVISLLSEMLAEPVFPEREVAVLQGQLLTSLAESDRDTGYRAHIAFIERLYPTGHPYGRPISGTAETVRAFTRANLLAQYLGHMHPSGMVLALVGSLDPDAAYAALNARLGSWKPACNAPSWASGVLALPETRLCHRVEIPAKPQISLMYGVLSMPRHSEDYYAAVVANAILGELGMMGRLGATIRDERGLVYDIESSLYANHAQRYWSISAGAAAESLDQTVDAIEHELGLMAQSPVSAEELADAKSLLIGSLPLYLETNDGIASYLLSTEIYGLGPDHLLRYPELIGTVTPEDVQRVMQRYWPEGRAVITAAGSLGAKAEG